MKRIRLWIALALTLLAIILILQNTAPVETRLLFVTLIMPRAFLLITTMLIGIALGMLISMTLARRSLSRG